MWIGYKEQSHAKTDSFKVNGYYHTDWLPPDKLSLRLDGLSTDAIYDGFIRQIAGDRLAMDKADSLKDAIKSDEKWQRLQKQIAALENKVNKGKQFNAQVQLNAELKALKRELEGLY